MNSSSIFEDSSGGGELEFMFSHIKSHMIRGPHPTQNPLSLALNLVLSLKIVKGEGKGRRRGEGSTGPVTHAAMSPPI